MCKHHYNQVYLFNPPPQRESKPVPTDGHFPSHPAAAPVLALGNLSVLFASFCVLVASHVRLFVISRTVAHWIPLSMEFFQARILEWVSFPSPGDLPGPGIEPPFPTLQSDSLSSEPPGICLIWIFHINESYNMWPFSVWLLFFFKKIIKKNYLFSLKDSCFRELCCIWLLLLSVIERFMYGVPCPYLSVFTDIV